MQNHWTWNLYQNSRKILWCHSHCHTECNCSFKWHLDQPICIPQVIRKKFISQKSTRKLVLNLAANKQGTQWLPLEQLWVGRSLIQPAKLVFLHKFLLTVSDMVAILINGSEPSENISFHLPIRLPGKIRLQNSPAALEEMLFGSFDNENKWELMVVRLHILWALGSLQQGI